MVRSRRPCPRCSANNVSSRERGFLGLLYHAQSRSLGTGAFVVDKSSSIVVRLDMRARPVACVSGAIDETLASCLLARAARPTVPSVFLLRPAPLAPSPMGQRPTTGSRLLPPFPDGFQRELGAAHGPGQLHNLGAAHSAQKFSSVGPAKYGFAAHMSRVQEPRSGVFRSLARQFGTASGLGGLALWHWGRPSFLGGVPLTEWAGPTGPGGDRREQRTTERACFKCFSSSDEARPCNGEGERCWCSISTCLSLLSRDHGPPTKPVLLGCRCRC